VEQVISEVKKRVKSKLQGLPDEDWLTEIKFEKILKELKNYKISPENITDILSVINRGQSCEQIEVTRILGIFNKRKLIIKNHS
jgi:hypothetical protein